MIHKVYFYYCTYNRHQPTVDTSAMNMNFKYQVILVTHEYHKKGHIEKVIHAKMNYTDL